jgi:hypothetical protein
MARSLIDPEPPRCFRCLSVFPPEALKPVTALCGCEHDYCEECIRDERLAGWLRYVGAICTKRALAA